MHRIADDPKANSKSPPNGIVCSLRWRMRHAQALPSSLTHLCYVWAQTGLEKYKAGVVLRRDVLDATTASIGSAYHMADAVNPKIAHKAVFN